MKYPPNKLDSYQLVPYYTRNFFDLLSVEPVDYLFPIQERVYINSDGSTEIRIFIPFWKFYGKTKNHRVLGWKLVAYDIKKQKYCIFSCDYFLNE